MDVNKIIVKIEDQVADKVIGQADDIAKKVDNSLEKVEDKVGQTTEVVGEKIESIIEKVEEISPEVKKVVDAMESNLAEVVDGREFTCFCSQWKLSLSITRKNKQNPPSKSEETPNKKKPEASLNIRSVGLPQSKVDPAPQ